MELALRSLLLLLLLYSLAVAMAAFSVVAQNVTTPPAPAVNQPNASIGDIMLTPVPDGTRKVLIFYGNGKEAPGWGEICADNTGVPEKSIADVICQQYGRKGGTFIQLPRDPDDKTRVWFYNVSCGHNPENLYHILRCQHDVGYQLSPQSSCSRTVGVLCSDTVLAESGSEGYPGQVYLCPPEGFYSLNQSVSMGLVVLYFPDSWRTINLKTQSDTSDLLDSLCRQLGFTRAVTNSGVARRASPYSFDYCYDVDRTMPYAYAQPYAWLTTDQVDCKGSSRACLGCCYNYPQHECTGSDECDSQDDLIISCTFDSSRKDQPSEGNPSLCTFSMDNQGTPLESSVCAQEQKEIPLQTFEIVVGILGPFALLGVILTVAGLCCLCVVRYRRWNDADEHQPIVNHPPPHDDAGN